MKIFLVVVYCILSGCCFCQALKVVKIGALESFKPWEEDNYSPGVLIRPLFIKQGKFWFETEKLQANERLRTYFNGIQNSTTVVRKKYKPFYGGLFAYYWPQTKISFRKRKVYKASLNKSEDTWLKGAVLLTNNTHVKQRISLSQYSPNKSERIALHDSLIALLKTLYENPNCWFGDSSAENMAFQDSLRSAKLSRSVEEMKFDSSLSFIDKKGNKLFTIEYPTLRVYGTYPFLNRCWREDDPGRFKVSFYEDKEGHLQFLGDELTFLDHGDFDDDGNEEYVFWYYRFNDEGYIMFYDNFTKKVEHTWNYH